MTVEELREQATNDDAPKAFKFFVISTLIVVFCVVSLAALTLYWLVQPVNITVVREPIEIRNPGNIIAPGEKILMRLHVDKAVAYETVETQRFVECRSGKLQAMTDGEARTLPVGRYFVDVDNITLVGSYQSGESCTFLFRNTYKINPFRNETAEWRSEAFYVKNPE